MRGRCLLFGLDLATTIYFALIAFGVLIVLLGSIGLELADFVGLETLTLASIFVFFGGSGIIFQSVGISPLIVVGLSSLTTVLLSISVHFGVVRQMKKAESSTTVSEQSFKHKIGVVTLT